MPPRARSRGSPRRPTPPPDRGALAGPWSTKARCHLAAGFRSSGIRDSGTGHGDDSLPRLAAPTAISHRRQLAAAALAVPLGRIVHRPAFLALERLHLLRWHVAQEGRHTVRQAPRV